MTAARVVFMGAKGGVGATTCAINFAAASALGGAKTIICDWAADGCGDVSLAFGDAAVRSVSDVCSNAHLLGPDALYGYCRTSPSGLGAIRCDGADVSHFDDVSRLLSGSYDTIVADAGHRLNAAVARMFEWATHFVLVVTPSIAVVRAAQRLLEEWRRMFVPRQSVLAIYNRYREGDFLSPALVKERLDIERLATLPDSGLAHTQAWRDGAPLSVADPSQAYVACLAGAMREFLGAAEAAESGAVDAGHITGARRTAATDLSHSGDEKFLRAHETVVRELHNEVERKGLQLEEMQRSDANSMRRLVESIACSVIGHLSPEELAGVDRAALLAGVLDESVGLGPIEPLLAEPDVSEVMVNGHGRVFVERNGRLFGTAAKFSSEAQLRRVIERIVARVGRRIDESSPMVDARLPDGSRVNIIIPPLSLTGPAVTIRRFPSRRLVMDDLCSRGSLSKSAADFLKRLIVERKNVIVSGGTGSGKTTLLNVLSAFIPPEERIVTIEDAAELQLAQPHVVRLESRQPNVEGKGAVTIRDLVRNALRMRPDRIIVGECRGGEALDMLQAMNTGHEGSLTTIHANSPRDCIGRLETLVMFAGMDLPSRAIREQIVSAIHYVIQLDRRPDGRRIVSSVEKIVGMNGDAPVLETCNVC